MPVAGEIRAIEVAAVVVPLGIHHRGIDTWNIPPTTDTGRDVDCRFCLDSLLDERGANIESFTVEGI